MERSVSFYRRNGIILTDAGAIGRSARVNLTYRHDKRWVGRKAISTNHGIIGFDFLWQDFKKIIVVRTRPRGFRREEKPLGEAQRFLYRKYPDFVAALERSSAVYNQECDRLDQLEHEGKAFVIYPSGQIQVSRLEGDMEKDRIFVYFFFILTYTIYRKLEISRIP